MGEATKRGTFEQRRMEAITQGRMKNNEISVNLITDTIEKKCECGGDLFDMAYRYRTLPSVSPKNPTGKDQAIKIEVLICRSCGKELKG